MTNVKRIDTVRRPDGTWVLRNRKLGTTYGPRFSTQAEATKAMMAENKRLESW